MTDDQKYNPRPETLLIHGGRHPERHSGAINTPVYRVSTVLSSTLDEWDAKSIARANREPGLYYGRFGTPTTDALTEAIAELEHAAGSFVYPSGVAAIAASLLSVLSAGDHLLIVDCAYSPTRGFSNRLLRRYGVSMSYVNPTAASDIEAAFLSNTKAVFVESPGSLTFEMQDIVAICEIAHRRGAVVLADNTWATPLYCRPIDLGVDVSIQAATKYIVGHSDAMLGVVSVNGACLDRLRQTTYDLGQIASGDDCYLAQRGLRTMAVRLERHHANALALIEWLVRQPEVDLIRCPAWPDDPGYRLWQRDFTGASGLFSIWLKPISREALSAFVDGLAYFGIGASWGGYESLIMPFDTTTVRSLPQKLPEGPALRLHAGLEHVDDLIDDLDKGFCRLRKAG